MNHWLYMTTIFLPGVETIVKGWLFSSMKIWLISITGGEYLWSGARSNRSRSSLVPIPFHTSKICKREGAKVVSRIFDNPFHMTAFKPRNCGRGTYFFRNWADQMEKTPKLLSPFAVPYYWWLQDIQRLWPLLSINEESTSCMGKGIQFGRAHGQSLSQSCDALQEEPENLCA